MHPILDIATGMPESMMLDAGESGFLHHNSRVSRSVGDHTDEFRQKAFLTIDNLNLTMVKIKLCLSVESEGEGWSKELADTVELWYKRFLKLHILCGGSNIVPTKVIDKMWHAHILDTRKYHADCEAIFGGYFHHFPYFGLRSEEDAKNLGIEYQRTLALFEKFFEESPMGTAVCCDGGGDGGGCASTHHPTPPLGIADGIR